MKVLKSCFVLIKNKKRVRLKYHNGYNPDYIGKVSCELVDIEDGVEIDVEGVSISLDYAQTDYLRKTLNAYYNYLDSHWLSKEERKESIFKLKKDK